MHRNAQRENRDDPPLTFSKALELAIQAGENVDNHWRQFYFFVFGLLAWLFSNFSKFDIIEAWVVTIATIGFFTVNAFATIRAYSLLKLLIAETKALANTTSFCSEVANKAVRKQSLNVSLPLRLPLTVLANALAAAAIVRLVWRNLQL